MKSLDFLIIGAQKSGTTTLFKLLSEHKEIFMPSGKEATFFTKDEIYDQGVELYLREFFRSAPSDSIWGTATPHYLSDPRVPDRVVETFPDTRIIAILRDPAERALSHYRMSFRRGFDTRTFEEAISSMLKPDHLERSRLLNAEKASESESYVVWGEYGRLLEKYSKNFSKEKILVLFTADLERAPSNTLTQIFDYLGVCDFTPESIGKRFHEGGASERFPVINRVKSIGAIRRSWKIIPRRHRSQVMYWLNQVNVKKEKDSLNNYDDKVVKELRKHYQTDINTLESLFEIRVPWRELYINSIL